MLLDTSARDSILSIAYRNTYINPNFLRCMTALILHEGIGIGHV